MSKKHYHSMNGEVGCIPDNNEIHNTLKDAIDYIADLFPELSEDALKALKKYRAIDRWDYPSMVGASIIKIVSCTDDCNPNDYPY